MCMLRRRHSFDRQLPGSPGLFNLQESIQDQEARIVARRHVMLALSGELTADKITFPMAGLSIGATGELHTIAEIVEKWGPQDKSLLDTFVLLPLFV